MTKVEIEREFDFGTCWRWKVSAVLNSLSKRCRVIEVRKEWCMNPLKVHLSAKVGISLEGKAAEGLLKVEELMRQMHNKIESEKTAK